MVELKIIKVGNSLGMRLPREVLNRLHLEDGDKVILTESPEGGYRLTPYDPDFEQRWCYRCVVSGFKQPVRIHSD